MIAAILGWLTGKIAGPMVAGAAILFALGFCWQSAQIDGWPLVGGGYKAEVAALQLQVADAVAARALFDARANAAIAKAQAGRRAAEDAQAAAYGAGQVQARIVTQTIIRKVPVYVSQKSDAACIVPWGVVRLFDAAASGTDPGVAAGLVAPGQSDDAASPVKLSDLVALLAQNFGVARGNADQLSHLEKAVAAH